MLLRLLYNFSLPDIIVPGTNSATNAQNSRIPAGENVLVIKTPRGVYLRTRQGKIFAVRTTPKDTVVSVSESTAHVTSSGDTTMSGLSTLASIASTSTATSCSTYGKKQLNNIICPPRWNLFIYGNQVLSCYYILLIHF